MKRRVPLLLGDYAKGRDNNIQLLRLLAATAVNSSARVGKLLDAGLMLPLGTSAVTIGLGMLIVRRIVREHGGELSIESSEGKGTRVTLTLPRGQRPVRFLESGSPDERKKSAQPEVIDV